MELRADISRLVGSVSLDRVYARSMIDLGRITDLRVRSGSAFPVQRLQS